MTTVIEARNLGKSYGKFRALDGISFEIPLGRIVGVIGANGAGKTTMLNAILGLTRYDGELKVMGKNPSTNRAKLMEDVCFISDVATLPRWMKVAQVLDYVESVHPKFDREVALDYLSRTTVPLDKKVRKLSKGMITQTHLAVIMAIDAKLLVLDEPTLGLDIIFRKGFYASLLEEYFDKHRTIVVTTHQVEEIEHILTDAMFIRDGEMVVYETMDDLAMRFCQVLVDQEDAGKARALDPIFEQKAFGKVNFVYNGVDKNKLKKLGDIKRVGLADLFVAYMTGGKR
ncbi:MAG: ABC transporter ATP-binding protein [Proteobacteria bacterium]|nr:ABC transporter ATP-binding protein [Pseudomonadota bacterium]MCH8081007.1 ABC transporter ATP-binding protein [Pseudomonadota bacterium]MCH8322220.1 ABC transporter ATP-binding protein [Pseudomonadota bacterium]